MWHWRKQFRPSRPEYFGKASCVVFKRRTPKTWLAAIRDFFWPRGGWTRAFHYVKHRLRRLPDSPERIARGIWAGVFTTFTPFYGMHFVVAAILALFMRGNILAALMGTFFGNPLTYVPIGRPVPATGPLASGLPAERGGRAFLWRQIRRRRQGSLAEPLGQGVRGTN